MGKNTTFHIHVKSEPGYSPKYPEHVFSVIGLSLCRHGLDHKLRQITNCDNSGILAVAFCDLSHFVIMAVTAQTESNNTINVFWVLGRVPMFTFDMNMKSFIFAHFGVISLLYLFVSMYISYKAHNRFTKETLLIVSDVDVYMFPVLRSIPSCTTDMNLRSCILNRHKMRQSQIATIQESLPSHFVICRILWSWPRRHKLSPITLKTYSGYFHFWHEYEKLYFCPFWCYFTGIYVYLHFISYKAHNRCTQETFLKGSDFDVNMFSALRSTPSVTMKSIWAVVFWTVTNCDSHKLRQFRNPRRRNLWFVAICDQGRDGTHWVK